MDEMPVHKRVKAMMYAAVIVLVLLSALLVNVYYQNADALDMHYKTYVAADVAGNVTIADNSGRPLYSGGSSGDRDLRLATFHVVGDMYGSVEGGVLSELVDERTSQKGSYTSQEEYIQLNINSELQKAAYRLLVEKGLNGTIMAVNYYTGDIAVMVSTPSVDVFDRENAQDGAFLNKAINDYVPGSVFKSVTVAAILEKHPEAFDEFTYDCTGEDGRMSCTSAHGRVTLESALYKSCNSGIAAAAEKYLTAAELNEFAGSCGVLSGDVIADMDSVAAGSIDAEDDLLWSAAGQSKDMTTPCAVAAYYSAIANGGVFTQLSLREGVEPEQRTVMSENTADRIREALTEGIEWYGSPIECECFGKTGTAQLDGVESHSWFAVCLTDREAPSYTIVVMIEHGGSSSLARAVAAEYINSELVQEG